MAKRNSVNLDITNNTDGFDISGGTTPRTLTVIGGNVAFSTSGSNTYTLPSTSGTLVDLSSTQSLSNKTIDSATSTIILPFSDLGSSTANATLSNSTFNTTINHTTGLFALGWTGNTSTNSICKISSTNTSATGYLLDVVADNTGSSIKPIRVQARQTTVIDTDAFGNLVISPKLQTSGNPTHLTITGAAHTGLASGFEVTDVNFNLARTIQRGLGTISLDRAVRFQGRTLSFVSSSTVTDAINVDIETVSAGGNASITRSTGLRVKPSLASHHGLWVDGTVSYTGDAAAFGLSGVKIIRFVGNGGNMDSVFNDNGSLSFNSTVGFQFISRIDSSSTPSGTPSSYNGSSPIVLQNDSSGGNYRLHSYLNSGWRTFPSTTSTDTLTNKTMSGSSNTFSNIGNSSLANSSVTIQGTTNQINTTSSSVSLGSSATLSLAANVVAAVSMQQFYTCV